MVDNRPRSSLNNITSVLNARYWTLSFGINRAYAHDYGYEIDYINANESTHPGRKVGWAKVRIMMDALGERGPERCAYGVYVDTDAYIRTSEPLTAIISTYGLDLDKLILFSQEHRKNDVGSGQRFINDGFFIVRNSPMGMGLLQKWYDIPEQHEDLAHLKENPQGLSMCWDLKLQPKYASVTVLGKPELFTAPLGMVVRHNWFQDRRFEQEMQELLLQRLVHRFKCILCRSAYDWDDSYNWDVGW